MKRLRFTLIIAVIVSFSNTYAQEIPQERQPNNYNYWTAKLPLLNFIDLTCPNLQLGVERRLDKHNAVQLIGGLSTDAIGSDRNGSFLNGYRLKSEYRRYFHVKRNFAFYAAAEAYYTNYRHYTSDSFISASSGIHYFDKFYLHKNMWGADLKWGLQRMLGEHWMFEFFAGFGFKEKTVTQTDRSAPSDPAIMHHAVDINAGEIANQLGTYTTITVPMNITLGYKFR